MEDVITLAIFLKTYGYGLAFYGVIALLSAFVVSRLLFYFFEGRKIQQRRDNPRLNDTYVPRKLIAEILAASKMLLFSILMGFGQKYLVDEGYLQLHTKSAELEGWPKYSLLGYQFLVYFVLFDVYYYFIHRFFFHSKRFWFIHKVHHDSITPNILTGFSFHWIEAFLTGGFNTFIMPMIIPLEQTALILNQTYGLLNTLTVHLGYEMYPLWWNKSMLTKWYLSTVFHDVHHSKYYCNFGGFTTIWDRLFGTVYAHYDQEIDKIVSNNEIFKKQGYVNSKEKQVVKDVTYDDLKGE
jgi:lathosterol oxidase